MKNARASAFPAGMIFLMALVACLGVEATAQDGLGRTAGSSGQDGLGRTADPAGKSTSTVRRPPKPQVARTPSGLAVPLGRPPKFYLEKGRELMAGEDFVSAKFVFEEGLKRARATKPPAPTETDLERGREEAGLFLAAAEAERQGNAAEAISVYERILEISPGQPTALRRAPEQLRVQIAEARKREDWDRVVRSLDHLVQFNPSAVPTEELTAALLKLAESVVRTDEASARAAFRRVLELSPGNRAATVGIGKLDAADRLRRAASAFEEKNYREAERLYSEAVRLDPTNGEAERGRIAAGAHLRRAQGDAAYGQRDFGEAKRLLAEAAQVLTDDPTLRARLAELALRTASAPPALGTARIVVRAGSPLKLECRGESVSARFLTGEKSAPPQVRLSSPLPFQTYTARVVRVSSNAKARIVGQPSLANEFAAEVIVEPKSQVGEDIEVDLEWRAAVKGRARWQARLDQGKYLLRWQGHFLDIEAVSGTAPENMAFSQDPLPHQQTELKLRPAGGSFAARLVSPGTVLNWFTSTIEVECPQPTTVVLEIEWTAR